MLTDSERSAMRGAAVVAALSAAQAMTSATRRIEEAVNPESDYQSAIENLATVAGVTAQDVHHLIETMNASPCQLPAQRAMNTNMHYPTSTPTWARRSK